MLGYFLSKHTPTLPPLGVWVKMSDQELERYRHDFAMAPARAAKECGMIAIAAFAVIVIATIIIAGFLFADEQIAEMKVIGEWTDATVN